ncbi:hypothetical protein [uncultured Bartonella sp.]|uniref:hypothetical protein n=1 Tax=uncultured Bartonella sp. TaxID=104108 RepID=UPI0025E58140|nr:hypothetical protein [uncultured Bartonella sp.]
MRYSAFNPQFQPINIVQSVPSPVMLFAIQWEDDNLNVPSSGIHTTLVPLEAGTESWPMEYIYMDIPNT